MVKGDDFDEIKSSFKYPPYFFYLFYKLEFCFAIYTHQPYRARILSRLHFRSCGVRRAYLIKWSNQKWSSTINLAPGPHFGIETENVSVMMGSIHI